MDTNVNVAPSATSISRLSAKALRRKIDDDHADEPGSAATRT
jgi:hypothetical protein